MSWLNYTFKLYEKLFDIFIYSIRELVLLLLPFCEIMNGACAKERKCVCCEKILILGCIIVANHSSDPFCFFHNNIFVKHVFKLSKQPDIGKNKTKIV